MKPTRTHMLLMIWGSFFSTQVMASSISTSFDTADGFITGDTDPVVLSDGDFTATFSGGQQQQMFDLSLIHISEPTRPY